MRFTLFITDALFFSLIAIAVIYFCYASKREHLRAPWRQVTKNSLAMAAATVLATFLTIAILDSIHFFPRLDALDGVENEIHYASEVLSLFDLIVSPLREQVEKTYSAPFAIHAFSKETLDLVEGRSVRDYPRLVYGGAHLNNISERTSDIVMRGMTGAVRGLLVWFSLTAVVFFCMSCKTSKTILSIVSTISRGDDEDGPCRTLMITTGIIAVMIGICASLAPHYHVFGTDKVGTDVLYQSLKSIRTGLIIGTLTTLVMLPFAIFLGISAGYFRGWIDDLIQYLYTTLSSIPGVLLIASAALLLEIYMSKHADEFGSLAARADLRLLALCIILGITSWTGLCRLLRGEILKLRESDFVEAARAFGVRHTTLIARHMLPNIMHIVMISIVLDFSGLVLAEAVLSYINIGVDPSMESWGNMINSARLELAREPIVWWSLLAALAFMFVLVLAANLFADAVRDAFDPRLRVLS